jgi:hypothetical protein
MCLVLDCVATDFLKKYYFLEFCTARSNMFLEFLCRKLYRVTEFPQTYTLAETITNEVIKVRSTVSEVYKPTNRPSLRTVGATCRNASESKHCISHVPSLNIILKIKLFLCLLHLNYTELVGQTRWRGVLMNPSGEDRNQRMCRESNSDCLARNSDYNNSCPDIISRKCRVYVRDAYKIDVLKNK